jgi:hypothetical protein
MYINEAIEMSEIPRPRYTREQIAQMATETVTVPRYSQEELVKMMNEAEGAPILFDSTPKNVPCITLYIIMFDCAK